MSETADERFMRACLREAERAAQTGEVPIGAVVVRAGEILSRAHNAPIGRQDPTAHAEIVALRAAALAVGNYRLPDAELYVTVEPCIMCVGAIVQARLSRVVFGCADQKAGGLGGALDVQQAAALNHRFAVTAGVRAEECLALLQAFFRDRRRRES